MSDHSEVKSDAQSAPFDFSDPTDRDAADALESNAAPSSYDATTSGAGDNDANGSASRGGDSYTSSSPQGSSHDAPRSPPYPSGGSRDDRGRLPNLAFKLYVGNLPHGANEKDIESLFMNSPVPCAPPTRIDMKNGYAFVHFERNDGLDDAMPQLNGAEVNGSKVRIEWSKPQTTRCFNCKQDGHWARDCPNGGGESRGSRYGGRGGDRDRGYGRRDRDRSPPGRYGGGSSYRDRSPRRGYSPRRSPPRDYHHSSSHHAYDPYARGYGAPPPGAYGMPPTPYYPPVPGAAPGASYPPPRDAPYAPGAAAPSGYAPPASRYY